MTLPAYTQFPVFKQLFWLFGGLINGIYEVLDFFGIANMGLVIIYATLIYQLIFLPSQISAAITARKQKLKAREMGELLHKYKDRSDTEDEKAALEKEKSEIESRYKKRKNHGCLMFIFRFVIILCFLNVLNFANVYIYAFASMTPEQLAEEYTFCGIYLLQTPSSNPRSLFIIPLIYCAVSIASTLLFRLVDKREEQEYQLSIQWIEDEKTEIEKEVEEEERRSSKKIEPLSIIKYAFFAFEPVLSLWLASITTVSVGIYFITRTVCSTIIKCAVTITCHKKMKSIQIAFPKDNKEEKTEGEEFIK